MSHTSKKTYLFHSEIFIPRKLREKLDSGIAVFNLTPSRHAKQKAESNKYLTKEDNQDDSVFVDIPTSLHIAPYQVFEIETDEYGRIIKIGVRINSVTVNNTENSYNKYDLCLIIEYTDNVIKTVYLNEKGDTHKSLDNSRYEQKHCFSGFVFETSSNQTKYGSQNI